VGIAQETPQVTYNRPGLDAIAYRVGTFRQFRDTLLARLQLSRQPFLAQLKARENDDFTISLLDSFATVADVLTFYTERYQNEAYLQTAKERRSILELAALIGYELRPGVAAHTFLAFNIDPNAGAFGSVLAPPLLTPTAPTTPQQVGKPDLAASFLVGVGTKVQSVPGPGQKPQTFETVEAVEARAEWNAMTPILLQQQIISPYAETLVLGGAASNLKTGDKLLLLPDETDLTNFYMRSVLDVEIQPDGKSTFVHLENWKGDPAGYYPPKYVPHGGCPEGLPSDFAPGTPLDVTAVDRILAKRWFAEDLVALAKMQQWSLDDLSNALNQRMSDPTQYPPVRGAVFVLRQQVATFGHNAPFYLSLQPNLRVSTVFHAGGGHTYTIPAAYPSNWEKWTLQTVGGDSQIYLDSLYPAILKSSYIVIQRTWNGKTDSEVAKVASNTEVTHTQSTLSAKVSLLELANPTNLARYRIRHTSILCQSEELDLTQVPVDTPVGGTTFPLDRAYVGLVPNQIVVIAGERADLPGVTVAEVATLDTVQLKCGITYVKLKDQLSYRYKRSTLKINANVALATHGETVTEVLGNGDGSQAFQSFPLHQSPLTYVSASTDSGTLSTLKIRVNDLLWTEVPYFYGHGPEELIYIVRQDNSGVSTVTFGDGKTGSRLPTGNANVSATYRFGIGSAGEVDANQLTLMTSRPLGVRGAINPLPAVNSADPETLEDARQNATLTIRTLGRIVSLEDYEDFARAFAGISKTLATWSWDGERRIVLITVAGTNGEPIDVTEDQAGTLAGDLLTAIAKSSEPGTKVQLNDYQARFFKIEGTVEVDKRFLLAEVTADIEDTLRGMFGFANRAFGQAVHRSEVIAAIQNVSGVIDVDITSFYRSDKAKSNEVHIPAALPQSGGTDFFSAELLMLDPAPLGLTETQ
jgi:predicted phage baseplate assembly protein